MRARRAASMKLDLPLVRRCDDGRAWCRRRARRESRRPDVASATSVDQPSRFDDARWRLAREARGSVDRRRPAGQGRVRATSPCPDRSAPTRASDSPVMSCRLACTVSPVATRCRAVSRRKRKAVLDSLAAGHRLAYECIAAAQQKIGVNRQIDGHVVVGLPTRARRSDIATSRRSF